MLIGAASSATTAKADGTMLALKLICEVCFHLTAVILLSYCCDTAVIQVLYHGHSIAILTLYFFHTDAIQVLCNCYRIAILTSYCCNSVVKLTFQYVLWHFYI